VHQACAPVGAPAEKRPAIELADIVRQHGETLRSRRALTPEQHAALHAIERCRTAALGGHLEVCLGCGHEKPSYNSCRNRHCPKCQSLAQARWIEGRMTRVLPTAYFHVVFTLPAELRAIAKLNRRFVFDAMFASAGAALVELGMDPKRLGALLGVTCVLHTWTRDLRFHPHIHCIVTGGGWSAAQERWIGGREHYLLPVRVLGALFRGKLMAALSATHRAGKLRLPDEPGPRDPESFDHLRTALFRKPWIVYAKRPFGGPEQVLRYLGRYTHRVGISNHRLVALDARGVTFHTKNGKTATLDPVVFLDRFIEHVLPHGFVKIRHYGLLAPSNISSHYARARAALQPAPSAPPSLVLSPPHDWHLLLLALTAIDVAVCPACGERAVVCQPLPVARAPPVAA